MNTKRPHPRGGFTLLELLMVVIIIGILAALALPQYLRTVERSRSAQVLLLMASIRGAELRYKAQDPGSLYTQTLTDLDIGVPVSPAGWVSPLSVSGTGPGEHVQAHRFGTAGGATGNEFILMNLDNGSICATTPAAATEWGVGAPGC